MAANTTSSTVMKKELPSLSWLFTESWNVLKQTWSHLLVLYILMSLAILGIGLVSLFVGGSIVVGGLFSQGPDVWENLGRSLTNPAMAAGLGILLVVVLLVIIFVSNAFSAALILAIDEDGRQSKTGELLKRGFSLVVPLFLTSLIVQFLVFGGLFLFLIPGIVMAILLSFAMYEVILGGARYQDALRNSVSIVKQNFGGIFVRWFVLIAIQMVISFVLNSLAENGGALEGVFALLSLVANIFFSLYTLVYGVLLYRAAREASSLGTTSITWMWIVSVIGWVVGAAFFVMAASVLSRIFSESLENMEYQDPTSFEQMDWSDEEAQQYMQEYQQLFEEYSGQEELTEEELDSFMQEILSATPEPFPVE